MSEEVSSQLFNLEMKIEEVKDEVTACYRGIRTMLILVMGLVILSGIF